MTALPNLIRAYLADPRDEATAAACSDWLEEQGDRDRAEFLRLHCALDRWVPDREERARLEQREQGLLAEHAGEWLGSPLRTFCDDWHSERGVLRLTVSGRRFVGQPFRKEAGESFGRAWVRSVRLLKAQKKHLAAFARMPLLEAVPALDLAGNELGDDAVRALASPHLEQLTSLNLANNRMTTAGVRALAESRSLPRLTALDLRNNQISREGLTTLLASPLGERLVWLDLQGNDLDRDGVEELVSWRQQTGAVNPDDRVPRLINSLGMELLRIPAGSFLMGSPEEEVGHDGTDVPFEPVTIERPIYLGLYPVTQQQYEWVTGTNPSRFTALARGGPHHPVEQVSWGDADAFCARLSEMRPEKEAGRVYRLPTEAEWEYACRAGTTTLFGCGPSISSHDANFDGHYPYGEVRRRGPTLGRTTRVGEYAPHGFGLYDLHGNAWEWCTDSYGRRHPVIDRGNTGSEAALAAGHILRGGCWRYGGGACRSAYRYWNINRVNQDDAGFRVVLEVTESGG
jgi:uncharacterized protein (TIGR02996 family)